MKKTLAIVLTLLVAFSMFSVAASAETVDIEDADVIVEFVNGGQSIKVVGYADIKDAKAAEFPEIVEKYEADEEVDGETRRFRYTFAGWRSNIDNQLYYPGTLSKHPAAKAIILTAEYSKEDLSERQSFWNLIESIFARINLIFEYFATIFNF